MSEPFLGEIRMMGFSFAPRGWASCDGQILPINQNQSLYSLLGTNFGGDGRTTFALPDLRGRTPIHVGSGYSLGQSGGEQSHTLSISEIPTHVHTLQATSSEGTSPIPAGNLPASSRDYMYRGAADLAQASSGSVSNSGASQAHQNMQPYLTVRFCIALQGIFPSRN